ncbi:EpsG-like putative glucosyltransferase [Flavobacterium cutihirudinis]|uniref:EpsG-like putative glucosyltransferase n=1 Tax=Flavobacterium cutihirudinis TaxID=1265740 RepID=A0A3D9FKQ4_9FLAO|nr:EpsG family protein [Flavobacterium cutihirudinis]RED19602.1 EpsG-like putative glucosyltransferase [Flavobacterium cutihirudinis]
MIYFLIIFFIIFSLIAFIPPKDIYQKNIIFFGFGVLLIFTAALREIGVDRDSVLYEEMFFNYDTSMVEPSFQLLSEFIQAHLDSNITYLFFLYAFFGVLTKLLAIKQLTKLWFLSLLIYLSNFYIIQELTTIRAGVASGFLMLCLKPIHDRDWKKFLLFVSIAVFFHYSALVILPLWFLGSKPRKQWLLLSIPLGYLVYFSGINLVGVIPIPGVQEKLEMYKQLQELGDEKATAINVFNLLFLARIVIFYFLLWKYDLIASNNKYFTLLIKIYCLGLVVFLIFSTMPVVAFRINELFSVTEIILIPLLFYGFTPRIFSKFIIEFIGLCFFFIVLFYNKLIAF